MSHLVRAALSRLAQKPSKAHQRSSSLATYWRPKQHRFYAIQFESKYADILKLDLKARFSRDTVSALRTHDRTTSESIRMIKENVSRWEQKHEKSAKDDDIVRIMLEMALLELATATAPSSSPWATDVILTDTERLVRTIRRYLPDQIPKDELAERILDIVRDTPDLPKDDLLAATRVIVFKLEGTAMPRDVYDCLKKHLQK